MQWWRRTVRVTLSKRIVGLFIIQALACERSAPIAGRKDTVVPVVPPPESTVVVKPVVSAWDSSAGPALFVVGATSQDAHVIASQYTDTASLDSIPFESRSFQSLRVDLFGNGKRLTTARISAVLGPSRTDSCRTWPNARLEITPNDTAAARGWTVAFEAGHAVAVPIDSIEALSTADSARLAADVARLASALPGDTSAVFRGLPFVVNKAWRTRIPSGQFVLTAIVVRNVNQEANPRQERILLIAERDSSNVAARFTPVYTERTVGLEETLETSDPIAFLLVGSDSHPTVIVARDAGKGLSYTIIERIAGRWRRGWASAYAGC
jgi:hypothetical protein